MGNRYFCFLFCINFDSNKRNICFILFIYKIYALYALGNSNDYH